MLNLLIGSDWLANRNEILRRLTLDIRSRKDRCILLVPELVSHETERLLSQCAGDTASRYAEVLSFTRLARRVSDYAVIPQEPCLDNGGRVVAMAAVARQLSSKLKAYASMETKPEFLSELIDAVDEFKRCCITSADLLTAAQSFEGNFAQKLEELSLIMEGYDAICAKGKRDPRDQMTWLLDQLEDTDFASDHTFYIDGFPDFTRQNMAIIRHLIQNSANVTVSLNCDRVGSSMMAFEKAGSTAQEILTFANHSGIPVHIDVIPERKDSLRIVRDKLFQGALTEASCKKILTTSRTDSAFSECLCAAEKISKLVRSGYRYRDISVICTDINLYKPMLEMVFSRCHIPLYCSGTEEILQKSVISTVLTAIDAALSGFDQKSVLRYLRSALSPLDPDTCDLVENYAVIWAIRGQNWKTTWTNHPEGLAAEWDDGSKNRLEMLNAARETAIIPLEILSNAFLNANTIKDQINGICLFLSHIHLEERLAALAQNMERTGNYRGAQILNQLWDILISALEQMYDVLGESHWSQEHFTSLFRLLLSQYNVGTIPPVLDAVQVGAVSAMRCHQQKQLILLGAEEGKLPGYSGSSGVLSDHERVALREMGVPLTGGSVEGIQAEFADIYGVFCGTTDSIHAYCSGEQQSFLFKRLVVLSGEISAEEGDLAYARSDPYEAAALFARWNDLETADFLNIREEYENVLQQRDYELGKISAERIRKLYGTTLQLSASQIDRQAECRLSYFLKYGLRAKERKEISIDPAEFGTYVHAVLENTAKCVLDLGGFHSVSLEETLQIAHRFSEEYASQRFSQLESDRILHLFRRNLRELDMVVQELWEELKDSQFQPVGFEVAFGNEDGLPPIGIPNHSMNAIVRGFVDRVDAWQTSGSSYYRVVDYKTGRKDFDYCDVFNGVGLQMLLYLFALRNSGDQSLGCHPYPAGVQYFPARAPYLSADGTLEEEEAVKARRSLWKRSGLLLEDASVLQAMEPGEQPHRMGYTIRKDGSYSGDLADRDQLHLLERYVFHILGKLVDDIASGNVEANPYTRGTSHNACSYCPYGAVCHAATVPGRRNYKAMKAKDFWDDIGKEMGEHGR